MDLLDSILNGMEKPPSAKRPEIKDKEKKEKWEKMVREKREAEKKQKDAINKFREEMSKKIKDFVNTPTTDDPKTFKYELEPMGKFYRSIVRECCDEFEDELVIHSFGTEELDRHCIIWRKGYEPCDAEIRCMKLGVEYKPKDLVIDDTGTTSPDEQLTQGKSEDGKDKFWSKYEKIIGENASGIESARVVLPAKQYGCVPVEKKKDLRSIEETMNDIRKTKKLKSGEATSAESAQPQDGEDLS